MALTRGRQRQLTNLQNLQAGGGTLTQHQQNRLNRLQTRAGGGGGNITIPQGQGQFGAPSYQGQNVNINNPNSVIGAQGQENLNAGYGTSTLANPNVYQPLGTQTYSFDEQGRPVITQSRNAEQQGLYNQEVGLESQANQMAQGLLPGAYNQPFSATGVQQAFSPIRNEVMEGLYKDFEAQYEPQFQQEQQQLEEWSRTTGNPPGSPGYNQRAQLMADNQNRARQSARAQAMQMGTQAVESGFGLGLQARNQPIQEVGALMSLGQGVQEAAFPGFTPTQVQPTNIAGIGSTYAQIKAQDRASRRAAGQQGANRAFQAAENEKDRREAERLLNEEQDRQAGGSTDDLVGGTASASAPRRGSFNNLGRAVRIRRPRRRRR
jgi:hypothetical protein